MVNIRYYPNLGIFALNDIKHQCAICRRTLVGKRRCRHRGASNKEMRRMRPQRHMVAKIAVGDVPVEGQQATGPSKSGWCPECTGEFHSRRALEAHIQTEHVVQPSAASIIPPARAKTALVENPKDRATQTNGEAFFDCTVCSARFATEHALNKHNINLRSCSACSMHLYPGQSLQEHFRTSLNHPHCHRCDLGFKNGVAFSMHQAHCTVTALDEDPGNKKAFVSGGHTRTKTAKRSLFKHLATLGAFDRRPGLSYRPELRLVSGHHGMHSSDSIQTPRVLLSQEKTKPDVLSVRDGGLPAPAPVLSLGNVGQCWCSECSENVATSALEPRCPICEEAFISLDDFHEHRMTVPGCVICKVHLGPSESLDSHFQTSPNHPTCDQCRISFETPFRYQMHLSDCSVPDHQTRTSFAMMPIDTATTLDTSPTRTTNLTTTTDSPKAATLDLVSNPEPVIAQSVNADDARCLPLVPFTVCELTPEERQDLAPTGDLEPGIVVCSNAAEVSPLCSTESGDNSHYEDLSQHGSESTYVTAIELEEHSTLSDSITNSIARRTPVAAVDTETTVVIPAQGAREDAGQDVSEDQHRISGSHRRVSFALPISSATVTQLPERTTARRSRAPHSVALREIKSAVPDAVKQEAAALSNAQSRWYCRLCFSDPCQDPVATICGHMFCYSCIIERLSTRMCCPACNMFFGVQLDVPGS